MVKVRIAPSPTGYLHIGTARTALFNWVFAKKMGGQFILRIEDTDLERSKPEYEKDIIDSLSWLGLKWDDEIYYQSKRLKEGMLYQDWLRKLSDNNNAFWCHHTKEELQEEQKKQIEKKEAPRHICSDKNTLIGRDAEIGQVIRLNVEKIISEAMGGDPIIRFDDKIRGSIEFDSRLLGDISIAKSNERFFYNFTTVVDDFCMNITHVIRGEDHISNTPKQILLYKAFGWPIPIFAHIPLILSEDRSKLSKRHGATSVSDFKKDYLPEAMINFMGFLGYTYSKEILTKEEMAQEFELEKVHKSGAVFDTKKLNWLNSQYIRELTPEELKKLVNIPELPDKAVPLITDRLEKLTDIQNFNYFWEEPKYDKELLKWKNFSFGEVKKVFENFISIPPTEYAKFSDKDYLRHMLDGLAIKIGDRGLTYWPLRVALTGKEKSPDPIDIALVLGKEKTLERIENAIKKLE